MFPHFNNDMQKPNTSHIKSFQYLENGDVKTHIFETIKSSKTLDPGFYHLSYNVMDKEIILKSTTCNELLQVYNFTNKELIDKAFESFFSNAVKMKMQSLGILHKLGILFHGIEGTGKSTIIKHYAQRLINEHNGIVIYFNEKTNILETWQFVEDLRKIQTTPIMVIFEEIDLNLSGYNNCEGSLKRIFDGDKSIDNCLFMASTNYFDRIPDAIKNRSSRFKYVLNIENIQCLETIKSLVTHFIGDLFDKNKIEDFSVDLMGETLDNIKHFCIDKIMTLQKFPKKEEKKIGF